jgi:uncharacterized membrane protein
MDVFLGEWANLLLRWAHMIVGIGWIGTSFYFMALDYSLDTTERKSKGVHGTAWQVHGGGFYHVEKFSVAPPNLPKHLHWFTWEAYLTWMTGFGLLAVQYHLHAPAYMIDPTVLPLTPWQAASLSVCSLAAGWFIYDLLCRSPIGSRTALLALCVFALILAATVFYAHVFSARAALVHVGAFIGTIMAVNVFAIIIPNQKKMVAAMLAGQVPAARLGEEGKTRSVHNNYLTLPVVFLMLSSHYPLVFATRYNWVIVAILLVIGPVIRHFYNERHAGREDPWWTWAVAAIGLAAVIWLTAAGPREDTRSSLPPTPTFAAVQDIVTSRCSMCHAAQPVWAGFAHAPKGVLLDTPERIRAHATVIGINTVHSSAMPPGNVTELSLAERRTLAAWLAAGAPAN